MYKICFHREPSIRPTSSGSGRNITTQTQKHQIQSSMGTNPGPSNQWRINFVYDSPSMIPPVWFHRIRFHLCNFAQIVIQPSYNFSLYHSTFVKYHSVRFHLQIFYLSCNSICYWAMPMLNLIFFQKGYLSSFVNAFFLYFLLTRKYSYYKTVIWKV